MSDFYHEIESWSSAFKTEAISFLLGQRLGSGLDRQVYIYEGNPEYVIKVETMSNDRFQNVREWLTWKSAEHITDLKKWFAPCVRISACGSFLLMARTSPVIAKDLPKKVPAFFTDLKHGNWGRLPDGRVVCHDYGTNMALDRGLSGRMRKAEWWT